MNLFVLLTFLIFKVVASTENLSEGFSSINEENVLETLETAIKGASKNPSFRLPDDFRDEDGNFKILRRFQPDLNNTDNFQTQSFPPITQVYII